MGGMGTRMRIGMNMNMDMSMGTSMSMGMVTGIITFMCFRGREARSTVSFCGLSG